MMIEDYLILINEFNVLVNLKVEQKGNTPVDHVGLKIRTFTPTSNIGSTDEERNITYGFIIAMDVALPLMTRDNRITITHPLLGVMSVKYFAPLAYSTELYVYRGKAVIVI